MTRAFRLLLLLLAAAAMPAKGPGLSVTLRVRDTTRSRAAFVSRYAKPLARALAAHGVGRVTVPYAVPRDPGTGGPGATRNLRLDLDDPTRGLSFLMAYLKAHPLPDGSGLAYIDGQRMVILQFVGPRPAAEEAPGSGAEG